MWFEFKVKVLSFLGSAFSPSVIFHRCVLKPTTLNLTCLIHHTWPWLSPLVHKVCHRDSSFYHSLWGKPIREGPGWHLLCAAFLKSVPHLSAPRACCRGSMITAFTQHYLPFHFSPLMNYKWLESKHWSIFISLFSSTYHGVRHVTARHNYLLNEVDIPLPVLHSICRGSCKKRSGRGSECRAKGLTSLCHFFFNLDKAVPATAPSAPPNSSPNCTKLVTGISCYSILSSKENS